MAEIRQCESMEEVRGEIDRIDREIVQLIAERGAYVRQAAGFKSSADAVRAPKRVEQVISKVAALANELGANAEVVERVYRTMISAFIDAEMSDYEARDQNGS